MNGIQPRVAIFDDWWPLHVGTDTGKLDKDEPSAWASLLEHPRFSSSNDWNDEKYYTIDDRRAVEEVFRIVQFRTCPICRQSMEPIPNFGDADLLVCLRCGYWGGRGHRDHNSHMHAVALRGVIGRYSPVRDLNGRQHTYLVSHLRRTPKHLGMVSPSRAEKFVVDLLADYLACEVRSLGGSKDGGIDGFIVKGDEIKTIIQVKWRADIDKAESISVVREVGGTLLAQGVPHGIVVSNRVRYSKATLREAAEMSKREIVGIGRITMTLMGYHDILDMLEISNAKLSAEMTVRDWFTVPEDICVFDGAMMIPERTLPSRSR